MSFHKNILLYEKDDFISFSKSFPLNDFFTVPNNPKSRIIKAGEYEGLFQIITFGISLLSFHLFSIMTGCIIKMQAKLVFPLFRLFLSILKSQLPLNGKGFQSRP